jgi:ABC-type uncharacterized transport system involved in gliding motility auxiliary subunit
MTDRSVTPRQIVVAAGLIGFILFACVNILSSAWLRNLRIDLTAQHLYSLAQGTRTTLDAINEPLRFRLFQSSGLTREAPQLVGFTQRVRALLETYAANSHGRITLEIIDPKPFSEDEDRAVAFGLSPMTASNGDQLFFGLAATNSTTGRSVVPAFSPDREAFLEYDLTRLVSELGRRGKAHIAVIDGLGLAGNPQMGQREQQVITQMKQFFNVSFIEPQTNTIADDVRLLMIAHPQNLPPTLLYSIDQYVLKGGATLVFVDPYAESQIDPRGGPPANASSTLDPLFKAWGINFDTSRAVADPIFALEANRTVEGRQVNAQNLPWLALREGAFTKGEAMLAQLSALVMTTAGSFTTTNDQVKLRPLITASIRAGTIDASLSSERGGDPRRFLSSFKPASAPLVIAARVSGTLTTAFDKIPDGVTSKDHLSASTEQPNVILVGDADMLMDRNWVQTRNVMGTAVPQAFANNGDFVINAAEQMIGGVALADLRGRGVSWHPFDRIQAMEAEADSRYRAKEQELTQQLKDTQEKLATLPRESQSSNDMLTPEQSKTIEKFRGQLFEIRAQLRDVQYALRSNVDHLKAWVIAINAAIIPLCVGAIALIFALRRPRTPLPTRTSSKEA